MPVRFSRTERNSPLKQINGSIGAAGKEGFIFEHAGSPVYFPYHSIRSVTKQNECFSIYVSDSIKEESDGTFLLIPLKHLKPGPSWLNPHAFPPGRIWRKEAYGEIAQAEPVSEPVPSVFDRFFQLHPLQREKNMPVHTVEKLLRYKAGNPAVLYLTSRKKE